MLFQTVEYLALLIFSVLAVRFLKNPTLKKISILGASILFYSVGGGWQTFLFAAVILFAYATAIVVKNNKNKLLFGAVLIVIFTPLMLYKYVPFFISEIFGRDNSEYVSMFVLPIGISFYTFQAVGYLVDVYRGKMEPVKNLLTFSCFISFFPQLVAGPIERATALTHQVETFARAKEEDYSVGFRHILIGLTLKLLVAETMAAFVNPVFNHLSSATGLSVLIATVCFGIQIYCDFNGYTQIAIGSAKLMGINLMKNFDHPYNSIRVAEFWRRWHISLTSWFRDYVYIPLGGNRKGKVRTTFNSLCTFTLSGIWHGANWTFLLWGFFNGLFISVEKFFQNKKKNIISTILGFLYTFIVINFLWIFFRANTVSDAIYAIKLIFTDTIHQIAQLNSISAILNFYLSSGWNRFMLVPLFVSILIYVFYEYGRLIKFDLFDKMNAKRTSLRWIIYTALIVSTLYFGQILEQSAFVYFRF